MSNRYREDKDLELLRYADNEMLGVLVEYLTKDKDGKARYTQQLTKDKDYQAANGNYQQVWQQIAAELQHFGGDTLVNFIRRSGVTYREILIDVCKKLSVQTNYKAEAVEDIEQALFAKLFQDSWEKMTESERDELRKELKIDESLTSSAAQTVIITAIRMGGVMSCKISIIIANAISKELLGKGLKVLVTVGATRAVLFVPGIGTAVAVLMTMPAISGPAFRVTLPAVVQIATMRQQMLTKEEQIF